jgi:hypothetical protein
MAFILSQKNSYTWPVKYEAAKDDGKMEKSEFLAEFKRLPQSRLDDYHARAKKFEVDDTEFLAEVLLGWSGIKTVEGEEVAFNDLNKRILLDLPGMRAAIVNAYFGSVLGAGRKN